MNPRILVTVSRSWSSWSVMREALEQIHDRYPTAVLVHGDAPKGDRQAGLMWRGMNGEVERWPAKWREHGGDCRCKDRSKTCRFAGFRRNVAMVESGPALVLAFIRNQSAGASHCAAVAEEAGIPTLRYPQDSVPRMVTVELPPMPEEEQ